MKQALETDRKSRVSASVKKRIMEIAVAKVVYDVLKRDFGFTSRNIISYTSQKSTPVSPVLPVLSLVGPESRLKSIVDELVKEVTASTSRISSNAAEFFQAKGVIDYA